MNNCMTVLPDSLRAQGNNLAACVGLSMADSLTYHLAPRVEDSEGNQYRWANAVVSDTFWNHLSTPLSLPAHDDGTIDLVAAQALLNGALVLTPDMLAEGYEIPDITGRLVIAPNMEPQSVLAALGLTPIEDDA